MGLYFVSMNMITSSQSVRSRASVGGSGGTATPGVSPKAKDLSTGTTGQMVFPVVVPAAAKAARTRDFQGDGGGAGAERGMQSGVR